jgi:hypothetical protein
VNNNLVGPFGRKRGRFAAQRLRMLLLRLQIIKRFSRQHFNGMENMNMNGVAMAARCNS